MTRKITLLGLLVIVILTLGCEDILEVPDISDQTVPILAPTNGSVLTDNAVSLNWSKIEDATSYEIQVATPNFENAAQLVLDSIVNLDSLDQVTTQIDQNLFNGPYEWRIKAWNSGYETTYTVSGFEVNGDENLDITPPNTPQPVSPTNGSTQSGTEVNFTWTRTDVPGTAERDSIFIYADENLQSLETKGLGANKTFSTNLSEGTFYWLVRAYDTAGNQSADSDTFNFTISN
nr:hypothetical protein [Allomuricauda sp.]